MTIIEMQQKIDRAGNARETGNREGWTEAELLNSLRSIMFHGCKRIVISGKKWKAIVCNGPGWISFVPADQLPS